MSFSISLVPSETNIGFKIGQSSIPWFFLLLKIGEGNSNCFFSHVSQFIFKHLQIYLFPENPINSGNFFINSLCNFPLYGLGSSYLSILVSTIFFLTVSEPIAYSFPYLFKLVHFIFSFIISEFCAYSTPYLSRLVCFICSMLWYPESPYLSNFVWYIFSSNSSSWE